MQVVRCSTAIQHHVHTNCRLVTAASESVRRILSDATTTTSGIISAAGIVGQDMYDLLTLYFVLTVEVDPDNGPYVQVW